MTRDEVKTALRRQIEALPENLRPHAQPLLESVERSSTDDWIMQNAATIIHALKFLRDAATGVEPGFRVVQ